MSVQLLTPKELANELGIKLSTVYYWSHIGYVPFVKLGRLLRFRKSSILEWLEKREKKGRIKRIPTMD
jgi:excisionase family DNA binding protein